MKEINIAKNITYLRKKNKLTQEQLATALNVSPQAVSKWETASCQPDTMTLPTIADYFEVSIDYLFYGKNMVYNEIFEKTMDKVAAQPAWTSDPYQEALKISAAAVYGILKGKLNDKGIDFIEDGTPVHVSDKNGIAFVIPQSFTAVASGDYLSGINSETLEIANKIFTALSNGNCMRITAEIIRFSEISYDELKEKTSFNDVVLRSSIEQCKSAGFVEEITSRHKAVGKTYIIRGHYYNSICFIFAAVEMIKTSLPGIKCWLNWGDFPLSLD